MVYSAATGDCRLPHSLPFWFPLIFLTVQPPWAQFGDPFFSLTVLIPIMISPSFMILNITVIDDFRFIPTSNLNLPRELQIICPAANQTDPRGHQTDISNLICPTLNFGSLLSTPAPPEAFLISGNDTSTLPVDQAKNKLILAPLFLSHPISNPAGRSAGSTFKIYSESNHISLQLPLISSKSCFPSPGLLYC